MKIKEVKIILKFLLNLDQVMLTLHIKTNMELEIIEEEVDQAQGKQRLELLQAQLHLKC